MAERTAAVAAREVALHVPRLRSLAMPLALAALAAAFLTGVAIGPVDIAPGIVVKVVLHHLFGTDVRVDPTFDAIVWDIRLPRVLLAAIVGASLAFSGATYQAVFRNPLADPYLLGVASGAGLAAAAVIVLDVPLEYGHISLVTVAAFGGALATVALTYSLARVSGHTANTTLILAGVAVSSIAVSLISYLMLLSRESTTTILSWLMGGLNRSGWHQMLFILPYTLPAAVLVGLHGRILNVLQFDEQQAQQLGVNVERTKLLLLVAASLAAAAAVAVAGIIGFVGLVAPHAVRLVVGPDYRRLLPLVAVVGAAFLIVADLCARTVLSPGELPVGVVTSIVGVPFFLWLLRRQRKAFF
ncbi:MAG TPA: iron ABC transporter permease [Dehalococcoidia bacterium]|jgi:iron complex transport system permease protein